MRLAAMLFAALLALQSLVSSPATAQEAPIRETIQNQMEAFRSDDFARAFSFASPTIKGIFGTPERFGQMVQQGYPMVHRPADVEMLELHEEQGQLWQRVLVTDAEGRGHVLDYQMVETPEGWKINAVELLRADGLGA